MPGGHHLRVQEQVPAGQREPGDQRQRTRPALRQLPADQQGRIGHHRPGQRDNHRYAKQLGTERAGVRVPAERHAGVRADRLGEKAAAGGHRDQRGGEPRPTGRQGVRDRGGEKQQHRRHGEAVAPVAGHERVGDLGQHCGGRQHRRDRRGWIHGAGCRAGGCHWVAGLVRQDEPPAARSVAQLVPARVLADHPRSPAPSRRTAPTARAGRRPTVPTARAGRDGVRSASTMSATVRPDAPNTPPPGCVDAPVR